MKNIKRESLKLFLLAISFGSFLTLVSAMCKRYEHDCPTDHIILPCIMKVFHIPIRQISYGLPLSWLISIEGIDQIGCGPIVGYFSTYSIQWLELLANMAFYTICSLAGIHTHHKSKQTNHPKSNTTK